MITFRKHLCLFLVAVLSTIALMPLSAQDDSSSSWSAGADLVTSFVWRGTRLGSGPHLQPGMEYSTGPFTAGAWGSFDMNGYEEVDLYFAFDLPGGFTLGMQDYYLPELPYFEYSAADGAHAFEVNLDWESDNVWLSANYIINEAGAVGSYGNDLYFEAGISFEYFSLFMGAGSGWHTGSGSFNVCNLGLEVTHDIAITELFSVPVTGQLIFNPDMEQMFLVAGFALHTFQSSR
jgi:hypothetical protein